MPDLDNFQSVVILRHIDCQDDENTPCEYPYIFQLGVFEFVSECGFPSAHRKECKEGNDHGGHYVCCYHEEVIAASKGRLN